MTPSLAIEIDLTGRVTLAELIEIEEIAGERLGERSGRALAAIALVLGRRQNPDLTAEDIGALEVELDGI